MRDPDEYFFGLCDYIATASKDPSTKVGAVIVGPGGEVRSTGFNGFPRRVMEEGTAIVADGKPDGLYAVDFTERWERPEKYQWVIHAELNAILNAARVGTPLDGCALYLPFDKPCNSCCGAIVNAGIVEVVIATTKFPGVGKGEHYDTEDIARAILKEGQVRLRYVNRPKVEPGLAIV